MSTDLLVFATHDGVVTAERWPDGWQECDRALTGHFATAIMARGGVILAGTTEGIFRRNGEGTWEEANVGLDLRHVRWMAYHPGIEDREFAGTEVRLPTFICNSSLPGWDGGSATAM